MSMSLVLHWSNEASVPDHVATTVLCCQALSSPTHIPTALLETKQ